MRPLLLLLLIASSLAVPSYYVAYPTSIITSISSQVKLRDDVANLALDLDAGTFSFNFSIYASGQNINPGYLPTATVSGDVGFTTQQAIIFSADNLTLACTQASSPELSLCPFIASIILGTWTFDYHVTADATDWLSITTSTTTIDPNTGKPLQFMGLNANPTFTCAAPPCASLASAVPQPSTLNVTVRRSLLSKRGCHISLTNKTRVSPQTPLR
jgi:hypothetical protein